MRHLQFSKAYYTETALLPPPHTPFGQTHTQTYHSSCNILGKTHSLVPWILAILKGEIKTILQLFLLIFFTCCASNVCISSPLCSIFVIFRLAVQAQVVHAVVSKLVAAPKLVSGIYLSKCKGCLPLHFLKWFPVLLV